MGRACEESGNVNGKTLSACRILCFGHAKSSIACRSRIFSTENNDETMSNIVDLIKPEYEVFYQILDVGIRRKEFKSNQSSHDLAYILYSMLTGLSITQFVGYNEKQFHILYRSAIDIFLKGISTKGAVQKADPHI